MVFNAIPETEAKAGNLLPGLARFCLPNSARYAEKMAKSCLFIFKYFIFK